MITAKDAEYRSGNGDGRPPDREVATEGVGRGGECPVALATRWRVRVHKCGWFAGEYRTSAELATIIDLADLGEA
jgi:hypothetical protein